MLDSTEFRVILSVIQGNLQSCSICPTPLLWGAHIILSLSCFPVPMFCSLCNNNPARCFYRESNLKGNWASSVIHLYGRFIVGWWICVVGTWGCMESVHNDTTMYNVGNALTHCSWGIQWCNQIPHRASGKWWNDAIYVKFCRICRNL